MVADVPGAAGTRCATARHRRCAVGQVPGIGDPSEVGFRGTEIEPRGAESVQEQPFLLGAGESPILIQQQLRRHRGRSEEHTSELQSLMRISYAVFCLKKKMNTDDTPTYTNTIQTQLIHEHAQINKNT